MMKTLAILICLVLAGEASAQCANGMCGAGFGFRRSNVQYSAPQYVQQPRVVRVVQVRTAPQPTTTQVSTDELIQRIKLLNERVEKLEKTNLEIQAAIKNLEPKPSPLYLEP